MQRYFGNIQDGFAYLSEDDQFHVVKVMRGKVNDQIEVVSDEKLFLCDIISLKPLKIRVGKEISTNVELTNDVVLIVSLLKGEKMDLVIQKATELGVEEIVLLKAERSIAKINKVDEEVKLNRYRRIAKEAAEQCKRIRIPLIYQVIDFNQLDKINADVKMIAYEGMAGTSANFKNKINKIKKGERLAVMIGPEGGFSSKEVEIASENGYRKISLGRRILRAETACFYALSVIAYTLELN